MNPEYYQKVPLAIWRAYFRGIRLSIYDRDSLCRKK